MLRLHIQTYPRLCPVELGDDIVSPKTHAMSGILNEIILWRCSLSSCGVLRPQLCN